MPLEDFALHPVDGPKLISFLKGLELNTLTRRVAAETDTDAAEVEATNVSVDGYDMRGPDLDRAAGSVSDAADDPMADAATRPAGGEAHYTPAALADAVSAHASSAKNRQHRL